MSCETVLGSRLGIGDGSAILSWRVPSEIGELMEIDYSSVSLGRKHFRTLLDQNRKFNLLLTRVQDRLMQNKDSTPMSPKAVPACSHAG